MGKKKSSSRKSESILYGQRPVKAPRHRFPIKSFLKKASYAAALVGAFVLVRIGVREVKDLYAVYFPKKTVAWKVTVRAAENESLDPDTTEKIEKDALALINGEESPDLAKIAEQLQHNEGAKIISLIQTNPQEFQIFATFRLPVFRVETPEGVKLLSDEGQIYGTPVSEQERELPLFSGLFAEGQKTLQWKEDNSVILTDVRQQIAKEVVNLNKLARDNRLAFHEIRYVQFRGFTLIDSQHDFEVSLGRPPFDKKISRLEKFLLKLKQKGVTASRIELDYEDKAFYKEKTL